MLDKYILRHLLILKVTKEEKILQLYSLHDSTDSCPCQFTVHILERLSHCSLRAHYFTQYQLNINELNVNWIISLFSHN